MPKEKKNRRQFQQKLVHPNSRKANKLGAKVLRKNRVNRAHEETNLKRGALIDKLLWFQKELDLDKQSFNKEEMCAIVEKYLQRFDEELEQIDIVKSMKHRKGRQHAPREDVILSTIAREREEFESSGLEVPDVLSVHGCELFRAWNGEAKYLQTLKLTKVTAITMGNVKSNLETNVNNEKVDLPDEMGSDSDKNKNDT